MAARRVIARIAIAVSLAALALAAFVPPLRHHAIAGGWGIAASSAAGIVAGLGYLRSTRGRP
jgi:hypothetical protein